MKSDILIFNPPQTKNGSELRSAILLWIASYLKRNGFNARIFYLDEKFKETIKRTLNDYKPKYAAICCKWYTNLYGAVLAAKEIKKINESIKVIAGGNTAAYFDKELLQNSEFDIVIRGDAERPLLNILKNEVPINCTVKEKGKIIRYKMECGHPALEDYALVDPKDILQNPKEILRGGNVIWTGKGCLQNCFYCGGSGMAQKEIFGRTGVMQRQMENVLADIAVFSKYSPKLLIDSPFPSQKETYYARLFENMPRGKFECRFYLWYLPTSRFIDKISDTFKTAIIILDTSTLCEELRQSLSKKKMLKPFFSNKKLEDVIRYCNEKKNIQVELNNIAGMPGETNEQVREHADFAKYLIQRYAVVTDIVYLPLSVEPGSLLSRNPKRFNMRCSRNGFKDYLNLTERAYKLNINYPFDDFFLNKSQKDILPHPYGVYEIGHSKKNSYLRMKYFIRHIDKELMVNKLLTTRRNHTD